jgi:hypothetical protein
MAETFLSISHIWVLINRKRPETILLFRGCGRCLERALQCLEKVVKLWGHGAGADGSQRELGWIMPAGISSVAWV